MGTSLYPLAMWFWANYLPSFQFYYLKIIMTNLSLFLFFDKPFSQGSSKNYMWVILFKALIIGSDVNKHIVTVLVIRWPFLELGQWCQPGVWPGTVAAKWFLCLADTAMAQHWVIWDKTWHPKSIQALSPTL